MNADVMRIGRSVDCKRHGSVTDGMEDVGRRVDKTFEA